MVAHDPFTGKTTRPTEVKIKRNKSGKTVEFPNDPHIQTPTVDDTPRPQTLHSGFAQGGTTNPPEGDDGSVKYYAPLDRFSGGVGDEEPDASAMFERDKEVNPVPHDTSPRFTRDEA